MRKWLLVLASICLLSAQASANVCGGVVSVGKEWTTVKWDGLPFPEGCRFRTSSKVGRRILATCPNGSECAIVVPAVPVGQSDPKIIKNIAHVERITIETDDPYKEGIRDYYAGQCWRARPSYDSEDKSALWEAGHKAAQRRAHNRVDFSHCFGT